MKIQLAGNNFGGDWTCSVCGQEFQLDMVTAIAYDDDGDRIGDVCPACLEAGPEGMPERMRGHAEALRERASNLRAMADWMDQEADRGLIEAPTLGEWRTAVNEAYAER